MLVILAALVVAVVAVVSALVLEAVRLSGRPRRSPAGVELAAMDYGVRSQRYASPHGSRNTG